MLTHILFQPSEVHLQERYRMSFRKKKATIMAFDDIKDKTYDAGSITYSIIDLNEYGVNLEDALEDEESEDFGEEDFIIWTIQHKKLLQKNLPFGGRVIFIQELDLNISLVTDDNLNLIFEALFDEHNIYQAFAAPDTLYPNPKANIKAYFKKHYWEALSSKYWMKL